MIEVETVECTSVFRESGVKLCVEFSSSPLSHLYVGRKQRNSSSMEMKSKLSYLMCIVWKKVSSKKSLSKSNRM